MIFVLPTLAQVAIPTAPQPTGDHFSDLLMVFTWIIGISGSLLAAYFFKFKPAQDKVTQDRIDNRAAMEQLHKDARAEKYQALYQALVNKLSELSAQQKEVTREIFEERGFRQKQNEDIIKNLQELSFTQEKLTDKICNLSQKKTLVGEGA